MAQNHRTILDIAIKKIGGQLSFDALPEREDSDLWLEIRTKYDLEVLELSALKKASCRRNNGEFHALSQPLSLFSPSFGVKFFLAPTLSLSTYITQRQPKLIPFSNTYVAICNSLPS
jgi:hypothetical protein